MTHTNTEGLSDERLQSLIDGAQHDIENQTSARYKREAVELHSIVTELQSRRAANSAGRVEVKGLEWHGPDYEDEYWAASIIGRYTIQAPTGNGRWLGGVGGYFHDIDEAKAAAQADFNQRILSALAHPSSPVSAEVTEAMVDAAIPHLRNLNIAGKDAWRKAVHNALLAALNGGRENG